MVEALPLAAQQGMWTVHYGDQFKRAHMQYGDRGVPDRDNHPGRRSGATTWIDSEGTLWLFGGTAVTDVYYNARVKGYESDVKNDLWKYDVKSDSWVWIAGDSDMGFHNTRYTSREFSSPDDNPGSRLGATGWIDDKDHLWLYGGQGYTTESSTKGRLADLWMFDIPTRQWHYMGGSLALNAAASYGQRGEATSKTTPGARWYATSWTKDGRFFLFGGLASASGITTELRYSDLWELDPATTQWRWISGASGTNQQGKYGLRKHGDETSMPGARDGALGWVGPDSAFWLFGGYGIQNKKKGHRNDFWRYDPGTGIWTWMSGDSSLNMPGIYTQQGVPDTTATPPVRWGAYGCVDKQGGLWMFGGAGPPVSGVTSGRSDLWRYNVSVGAWTFVRGDTAVDSYGILGRRGDTTVEHFPESSYNRPWWVDKRGWMWLEETRVFDPERGTWYWVAGEARGASDYDGVLHPGVEDIGALPASRVGAVTWVTPDGTFWMFGGRVAGSPDGMTGTAGYSHSLWKYDRFANHWTLVRYGKPGRYYGVYGVCGIPSDSTIPGCRYEGQGWVGNDGTLWLYGGSGYAGSRIGNLGDMWRFDPATNQWTWMAGDSICDVKAQKWSGPLATPGARYIAARWKRKDGSFWLFSGNNGNDLSDLWRFDPQTLLWSYYDTDVPGWPKFAQGVRLGGWTIDREDRLLIYGDAGGEGSLWRFDPAITQWSKLTPPYFGPSDNGLPRFGVLRQPSDSTTPAQHRDAVMWTDTVGRIYLFGGESFYRNFANHHFLNDMWRFDPSTSQWEWLGGDSVMAPDYYAWQHVAVMGTPSPNNWPEANTDRIPTWFVPGDTLWCMIGGIRPAMWSYAVFQPYNAFPLDAGPDQMICRGEEVVLGPSPHLGYRYVWERLGVSETPLHIRPEGTHAYILTAFDSASGSVATDTVLITVAPSPSAAFNYRVSTDTVMFEAPFPGAERWHWEFGDGSNSDERAPVHRYHATGVYSVSLVVESSCGSDTVVRSVMIDAITAVEQPAMSPTECEVVPTITNDVVELRYCLEQTARVTITLVDARGETRDVIVDEVRKFGRYSQSLRLEELEPGTFWVHFLIGRKSGVRRVLIVH